MTAPYTSNMHSPLKKSHHASATALMESDALTIAADTNDTEAALRSAATDVDAALAVDDTGTGSEVSSETDSDITDDLSEGESSVLSAVF